VDYFVEVVSAGHNGPGRAATGRQTEKTEMTLGNGTPRANISQMANIASVSHRSWAVDIKHGQNEGQKNRGQHTPREERAQTARNPPRKATWGRTWAKAQVMPMKWRHLIRKPAKLTGTRRELCTWGEPTRTWGG
jgi:hypothetical protein